MFSALQFGNRSNATGTMKGLGEPKTDSLRYRRPDLGEQAGLECEGISPWLGRLLAVWLCLPVAGQAEVSEQTEPWGSLRSVPVDLYPSEIPHWSEIDRPELKALMLPHLKRDEVGRSLQEAGLSPAVLDDFEGEASWRNLPGGLEWSPSWKFLASLTRTDRAAFYDWVWEHSSTPPPPRITILDNDLSGFTRGMPRKMSRLVRKIAYPLGQSLVLTDYPHLFTLPAFRGREDVLQRAIYRTTGRLAWLVLDSSTDLDQVRAYWSAGGRNPRAETLLSGLRLAPGETVEIDLGHLLPPLARKCLNRYFSAEEQIHSNLPDCFWTSVNFFAEAPTARALDRVSFQYFFGSGYERVERAERLGDIYLITNPQTGEFVHACTHLAGDLVFSKNGADTSNPWVVMPRETMEKMYLCFEELEVSVLRQRQPPNREL